MPMIGTESEVAGTFSATISMKTEKATKQVKPSVTFSPDDVGNLSRNVLRSDSICRLSYQNDMHVKHDNIAHGIITLKM